MFHLLLTACLAANPAICAERLLPTSGGCEAVAPGHTQAWLERHAELVGQGWRCVPLADLPSLSLAEVAPGVHVHEGAVALTSAANGGAIANLGVIIGSDGIAVIDAGASRAQGEALYAAIRTLSDLPIRYLILTHIHPDHSFGAEVFQEAGAEILAARSFTPAMEARAASYMESYARQIGAEALLGTRIVLPDRAVAEAELSLGADHVLRLVAQPTAHTDNDLTVLHQPSGTLFTGDLVFQGLAPTLDGSISGWLEWLETPPQARQIVPGHGPAPLPWREGAGPVTTYLSNLRDTIRAALAEGRPMSEVINLPPPSGWVGAEESHPRNLSAAYQELEWE